jgi:hypothetical protein
VSETAERDRAPDLRRPTRRPLRRRRAKLPRSRLRLGAAPLLAILAGAGVIVVALANNAARDSADYSEGLFWAGLGVIYAPIALRLFMPSPSRYERLTLVVVLASALYVVKVLHNPTGFTLHDELASWRGVFDFLHTGHLFEDNPIVPNYSVYPGMTAVTGALADLTGLGIFESGLLLIAFARVFFMVALFLFLERVTHSARAAGIGALVYACNPSFLYFDSQFGYESMALLPAGAMLLASLRWARLPRSGSTGPARSLAVTIVLLACTLAISHHMTSLALFGFLLLWAILIPVAAGTAPTPASPGGPRRSGFPRGPAFPALAMAAATSLWFLFVAAGETVNELGGVFTDAFDSVADLVLGNSGTKELFASQTNRHAELARVVGFASVVPLMVMLPLGAWNVWRRWRWSALSLTLTLVALLYPATLALRLTAAGSETSQRASEFVFVGLSYVAGILLLDRGRTGGRLRRGAVALGLAATATVVFMGGLIVGEAPATRQPGPYLVAAESRSVSGPGIEAARFAAKALPAGSRILVDRPNGNLMGAYGKLDPVVGTVAGIPVSDVFFSRRFDASSQTVISDNQIDYIVVDRRLSRELPVAGYYFEPDESDAFDRSEPIDRFALRKFDHTRGLSRIFDNGAIVIYDTSARRSD